MKAFVIVDSDGLNVWGGYTSEARANEELAKANKSTVGFGSLGDVWYNKFEIDIEIKDEN